MEEAAKLTKTERGKHNSSSERDEQQRLDGIVPCKDPKNGMKEKDLTRNFVAAETRFSGTSSQAHTP